MIQSVTVTNHVGDSLQLILRNPLASGLVVSKIDGLGPVDANINMTDYAFLDGSRFNSAHVKPRNVILTLHPLEPDVEGNRLTMYRFFPVKKQIKMEVLTSKRNATITGYVESVDPVIFSKSEEAQVSILCPDPYFYADSEETVVFDSYTPMFSFPFSNEGPAPVLVMSDYTSPYTRRIFYSGDYDIGVTARIAFSAAPTADMSIYNAEVNATMKVLYSKLPATPVNGDVLEIVTTAGKKSVRLRHEGVYMNAINAIDMTREWLQIHPGYNTISHNLENATLSLSYRASYSGV